MVKEFDLEITKSYALFLAHGDDEIGAIPIVLKHPPALVLYLTNGGGIGEKNLSIKRKINVLTCECRHQSLLLLGANIAQPSPAMLRSRRETRTLKNLSV